MFKCEITKLLFLHVYRIRFEYKLGKIHRPIRELDLDESDIHVLLNCLNVSAQSPRCSCIYTKDTYACSMYQSRGVLNSVV